MEADLAQAEIEGRPTGLHVSHPLTGDPVPVWVGNYVLMTYGEGAVMGVPAHDERDFKFAIKNGIPIRQVIDIDAAAKARLDTEIDAQRFDPGQWAAWYATKENVVCVNSGKYDGLDYAAAVTAIARDLQALGLGEKQVQWRLRDWGISRQLLLGLPDSADSLPRLWRRPRPGGTAAGAPAGGDWCLMAAAILWRRRRPSTWRWSCPGNAARRRGAKPTRWTPLWTRPGTFSAIRAPTTTTPWWMDGWTIGRLWINTSAGSSMPSCIFFIHDSGRG